MVLEDFLYFLFYLFIVKMLLFTMYVNDEYTANKMMMAAKKFRKRTYNRRSLAETGMFCFKQKYGSSVSSKSAKTI